MEDIKYAVIAFANTEGGKLYIGVNDDGTVYGVSDLDQTMLKLTNMIRDTIRPDITMFTDYTVEKMNQEDVIVLTVQRGTARPYYLHSKGVRPEGVYARSLNQQLTFEKASAYFSKKMWILVKHKKRHSI